jgi:hypothetical protein
MDVKLAFKDFIKTYEESETVGVSREIIIVIISEQPLELYKYALYLGGDDEDVVIYTHPDHTEVEIDDYVQFALDMQLAMHKESTHGRQGNSSEAQGEDDGRPAILPAEAEKDGADS